MIERDRMLAQRLHELSQALGTFPDLSSYLRQVASAAQSLTGSEAAYVFEVDPRGRSLTCIARSPDLGPGAQLPRLSIGQSAAGWAIRDQRSIAASQTAGSGHPLGEDDLALTPGTHSVLAVPLMVRGKALGSLLAANGDGSHYTEEDCAILETLSPFAALSIENAALQRGMEESAAAYSELDRLKTDFIAITSHELRTPLGVVLGHATFLRELLGPQYQDQLEVIIRNASRLKEIVESLSSMDNFKTGGSRLRLEEFDLWDLVGEVLQSVSEIALKRNVQLRADPPTQPLIIQADRTKLGVALGNLVRNALAFTDPGGHVLVRCESLQGSAKISVSDDGVGIPAKDLPRVFERFFQVESHLTRHHGGMGLGLAVAKAMVEMHGGRIWAESTEGEGSIFSILIPGTPEPARPASDVPE